VTIEVLTTWPAFGRVFAADRDRIAAPDRAGDRRTVLESLSSNRAESSQLDLVGAMDVREDVRCTFAVVIGESDSSLPSTKAHREARHQSGSI